MNLRNIQAVIWDIDDVLVDTKSHHRKSQMLVLGKLGISGELLDIAIETWDHLFWYFCQDDYEGILRALIKELEIDLNFSDEQLRGIGQQADLVWQDSLPRKLYTKECLDFFKRHNFKQGVASNGRKYFQFRKLKDAELLQYFSENHIKIAPSGTHSAKPNPQTLDQCCQSMGISPENTIYIGDRITDIIAANLANCHSILVKANAPEKKEPPKLKLKLETPNIIFDNILALYEWANATFGFPPEIS